MFNKIVRVLKRNTVPTGFEAYMNSVHRVGGSPGPTLDEARKDYKNISPYSF